MEARFAKEHGLSSSLEEYLRLSEEVREDMLMLMEGEALQLQRMNQPDLKKDRHGR